MGGEARREGRERIMVKRFLHWVFKSRRKMCRSCCLFCKFFDQCEGDDG